MLEGAFSFDRPIDRWVPDPIEWGLLRSEKFFYVAMPDTMVPVDRLVEHYAWCDQQIADLIADGYTYAGADASPVRPLSEVARRRLGGQEVAAFGTSEVAIDPWPLRLTLIDSLGYQDVGFVGSTTVHHVERDNGGFTVTATGADGVPAELHSDAVVNCLWDGRLAIDASMGIAPPRPWSYRLKYAVHGTMPTGSCPPPSATLVLGPFGDVVQYKSGRVYASWYPDCMVGWSDDLVTPSSWRIATDGADTEELKRDVATRTLRALDAVTPGIRELKVDDVAAGVVVAWGELDIDHEASALHQRDAIGVDDHDGYLSVNTGKFTTAPLFAQRVADLLGS